METTTIPKIVALSLILASFSPSTSSVSPTYLKKLSLLAYRKLLKIIRRIKSGDAVSR